MDNLPSGSWHPEIFAYLADPPWPTDRPRSPAARDTWPLPADPNYIEALARSSLEDADRRRRGAHTRLWDAYAAHGAGSPEFREAQHAWVQTYDVWREVIVIAQELLGRELAGPAIPRR
jgi:hypothetical protein